MAGLVERHMFALCACICIHRRRHTDGGRLRATYVAVPMAAAARPAHVPLPLGALRPPAVGSDTGATGRGAAGEAAGKPLGVVSGRLRFGDAFFVATWLKALGEAQRRLGLYGVGGAGGRAGEQRALRGGPASEATRAADGRRADGWALDGRGASGGRAALWTLRQGQAAGKRRKPPAACSMGSERRAAK